MSNTIQPFIEMVRRHEPRFYAFVHSVHKNDATGIFDGLLAYIDRILNGMNQGILSSHLDLGKIVTSQLSVAEYPALVAEIDVLCDHHLARKARHLEQVRQRAEAAAREGREEVEMEAVVSGLVRSEELEGVMNEMQELDFSSDDEEDEEAEWDELEMEEEVERVANGVKSGRWWKKQQWPKGEGDEPAPPPKLVVIPKLVPGFLEAIVRGLAV
ncbi:hypothetical protein BC936DRAFT_141192 [Jimgerdemannia flammicorona]|nr:hypothetical protein BC936DRAFT_141192 [Jimgerdemannia flammicorona]